MVARWFAPRGEWEEDDDEDKQPKTAEERDEEFESVQWGKGWNIRARWWTDAQWEAWRACLRDYTPAQFAADKAKVRATVATYDEALVEAGKPGGGD